MSQTTMMLDGNAEAVQVMRPKPGGTTSLSIGGSAQNGSAFTVKTGVRLYCDAECFVECGPSATATTSSMPMPSGGVEYFYVNKNDRFSVLQKDGSSGNLYITEMA